jgi:hypothetical protein
LRKRELLGGFPHAAHFRNRHENVQVVQLEGTADPIDPFHHEGASANLICDAKQLPRSRSHDLGNPLQSARPV